MSNQSLFEKLELKDEKTVLIQGIPSSIEKQFAKLSYAKNVTPLLKSKKVDFALIFAINQAQLDGILKDVFRALHHNSKLWVAYPKHTSKIVSDLNRDCSWQILTSNHYEELNGIEIDHVWSAIRFKRLDNAPEEIAPVAEKKIISTPPTHSVDFDKNLVVQSLELQTIFSKHKKAKDFFTSLSESHQKEYVSWIEGAKKEDTRLRRLDAVVEKLNAGKKSPLEK